MPTPTISKQWSTLPSDYKFTTFDQLGRDLMAKMLLTLSGTFTYLNQGSTEPSSENQQYLWYNTNDQRVYRYYNGKWVSKHPVQALSNERRIWVGSETGLISYDGGAAGTVSEYSGPFWELDSTLSGRMPIGAGTLESGTVVSVASTGGAEKHTLSLAEMPYHRHVPPEGTNFLGSTSTVGLDSGGGYVAPDILNTATSYAGGDPSADNATSPHNNMPPYYGVYFMKRTARVYYTSTDLVTSSGANASSGVYFGNGEPTFTPSGNEGIYVDVDTRSLYIWDGSDWGIGE